jgi:hypothetical protein
MQYSRMVTRIGMKSPRWYWVERKSNSCGVVPNESEIAVVTAFPLRSDGMI